MTDAAEPGRGMLALLVDRNFGPFMAGRLLSSSGMWMQNLAAAVLMFHLTESAVMVGAVSALQFLPLLVFSLWAGALTDRMNRRRLLLSGRILSGVTLAGLGSLILLRGTDGFGGPPVLLAAVFVMGLGFSVSGPAMHALVPALVPPAELERALALNSMAPGVGRTAGPALAGLVLVAGGPGIAFLLAAAFHLMYVAVLLAIKDRGHEREAGTPALLGGLRYLWDDRTAGALMLGVGLLSFGADPAVTLTPSVAAELGRGDDVVGYLASGFGLGALIAIPAFGAMRKRMTLRLTGMTGFLGLGAGTAVVALSPNVSGAITGFFIAGMGLILGQISLTTRIQRRVPDRLRGRVMAMWTLAWLGTRPIAAMVNGLLADLVSLRVALLVAASVSAGASMISRIRYRDA